KDAHNQGLVCVKGLVNRDILYARDRLLHPQIRRNGELQQATWDEAMSLVAERFGEAIANKGPQSVAYYGSGQLLTQETYSANKLFKAGVRSNNVEGNPRLCMASAVTGYISVYGKDEPPGAYDDIDHASCFFLTGSNTLECHPVLWERLKGRRRGHPDTKVILVDPRRTPTAAYADIHLAIRPGTDVALYNAMMYEFVRNDFIDEDMVENHLTFKQGDEARDFDAFVAHLENYRPATAAEICGVESRAIEEAAWVFASSAATTSMWTMGLNQQVQATSANRLVNAMHLVTGQIGRPGATPLSLTGQPNACGGVRDTGSLSHALPAGRVVANAQHRAEMEAAWSVEPGTIQPAPGHHTVALFEAMGQGDVDCCLIMCTNPMHSMPNLNEVRKGMERAFVVVADSFHPTPTTELADVVLPAAMWVEKEGVMGNTERRYHLSPKLVEPPGEARSDLEILLDLADRLGHGDLLSARTPEAIWDEWRKISADTTYNFEGITMERLRAERGVRWPCPTEDHAGTIRRYVPGDDPLAKGSGRIDFYGRPDRRAVVWLESQEPDVDPLTEEYPLTLTTGRVLEHWHTMTMTGRVPDLENIHPDYLEIHATDARQRGISHGDPIVVRSRRGEVELKAHISDRARPGLVFATMHSPTWLTNLVTDDAHDPVSKEPAYKRCAVAVERRMA
ncbi:MAG: nitrate reductase, partial [Pseudomonadota bacterium]